MFQSSETIKDLEIPEGRRLLHDFFHDRRVKNLLEFRTILDCWRLCRKGMEIQFSDGRRVRLQTRLGFRLGTRIFFEEIIGRYYYNFISGLVYGGAMLVLIALALYLGGYVPELIPFVAFAVTAVFLLLLALVTAYSPNEDSPGGSAAGASEILLSSMNGTVREMTNAVADLFRLISQSDIRQDVLLTRLTEHVSKTNSENVRKYVDKLDETNNLLRLFLETSFSNQTELVNRHAAALEQTREAIEALGRRAKPADASANEGDLSRRLETGQSA